MPIRFRCHHCQQLLSIATRKAGQEVDCPMCGQPVAVPLADEWRPSGAEPGHRASAEDAAGAAPRRISEAVEDEGLVLRRPETEFEEMDLTPMVDVTFLLLIFFMITASFSLQKTLEVPPPDPERQGAAQSIQSLDDLLDDSIKVEVDPRNTIYVDDERLDDPDRLADALRDRMRSNLKTELLLDAHEEALHETVVAVVDAANEAGLQKIRMVARTGKTGR